MNQEKSTRSRAHGPQSGERKQRAQRPGALLPLILALLLALAGCASLTPTDEPVATQEQPDSQEHFEKGNTLAESQQFEEAIAEYEAALAQDPAFASARVNLGVVYYQVGRFDEAIAQYQKALEQAPEDADIHSNLAAAHVQMNQLDEALQEYMRAVELQPDLAQAHFGLGVVHMQQGRLDEAIQAMERFQELDRGKDPTATKLAEQYLQQLKGP